MKIAILESLGISDEQLAEYQKPFEDEGHTFAVYPRETDTEILKKEVSDADAMILANMPMPNEVISSAQHLKFIDVAFTGVDHVGLEAAKHSGIAVSNASGYSNEAVAELAVGMALAIGRNLSAVEARCREGKTKDRLVGTELKGKTVGIVGLGKIGTRSAELFHAFGCRILASSRTTHEDAPEYVEQISRSNIVVLHCPLTETTRGLIDKTKMGMMKKNAILINVARGPVVVTADLANALQDGTIAGAGIDVFDSEPPLSSDEPLLNCPNCLVTPHVAFATKESMILRADIVFDNLRSWMEGKQKNIIL